MASTLERPRVGMEAPRHRPARPICFVAWGAVAGRSEEIAASIGGEARCFFAPGPGRRPPVLARYFLAALGTTLYLLRRRPRAVIVTNPPVFASLVSYCYTRLSGAMLVLDSHPGGFGAQGDRVAARLQCLHRWIVPRADLVLVTDESWADTVGAWGGSAAVIHEAPAEWDCGAPVRHERLAVLVIGRLAADEPVEEVLAAARATPGCDFILTGDVTRAPSELVAAAPDNVRFVGFLPPDPYRALVESADAVLALTTEPTSVMRAAYEAVYARRPLVVSDWPLGRQLFPHAWHAANDGPSIAAAVTSLDADYERAVGSLEVARRLQLERWSEQEAVLLGALTRARNRTE